MPYTDFLPLLSALGGLIMLLMLLFHILALSGRYLYRAKKRGARCIGCPRGCSCSGKCGGCQCAESEESASSQ